MSSFLFLIASAVVAASSAAAAPVEQFDLVCQGPVTIMRPDMKDYPKPKDETVRLRVDLRRLRWCEDDCRYVWPIKAATADLISFDWTDYPVLGVTAHPTGNETVNRRTGVLSMNYAVGRITISGELPCTKAAFTPFPAPKF